MIHTADRDIGCDVCQCITHEGEEIYTWNGGEKFLLVCVLCMQTIEGLT